MDLQTAFDSECCLLKGRVRKNGEVEIGYIDDISLDSASDGVGLFLVIRYQSGNREVGPGDFSQYQFLDELPLSKINESITILDTTVLESLEESILNKEIIDRRDGSVGQIHQIAFDYHGLYLGVRYGSKTRKIRTPAFKNYSIRQS